MTVVVGFVPTAEGAAAVDRGVEEARLRGLPLVVVHSSRGGEREAQSDWELRDELDRLGQRLRADGVDADVHEIVRGHSPAEDLLQVARDRAASLIVIGLRRRTSVGKLLLGSNAQQILMAADCPVLAVKPD